MKALYLLTLLLLSFSSSYARTLEVGSGKEFASLQAAATQAAPGDIILIHDGVYGSAGQIVNLKGTEQAPIVIRAAPGATVIFRGGSNGIQLTDPAWLYIEGLIFEQQTGNGMNIDDGGSFETPAAFVYIRHCEFRALNASGNNDQLKLSGLEQFRVDSCRFFDGAEGGSAVDMVGCKLGRFTGNLFQNAGSNSIQAKGGSSSITITHNRFKDGGQRSINIGGSTGRDFFRPPDADYEARNIVVRANIFEGSVAPIAFVGAVGCAVSNNTIIRPERWAVRILQENVEDMLPCSSNEFYNNIIVFTSQQPTFNIGDNTSPETFSISHNLWFNPENSSWQGPNTPVNEPGRILNQDPQFIDNESFIIPTTSPAYRTGRDLSFLETDYYGNNFSNPPSIGAVQGQAASVHDRDRADAQRIVYPNPTSGVVFVGFNTSDVQVIDIMGRIMWQGTPDVHGSIDLSQLPSGQYVVIADNERVRIVKE